MAAAAAAAAIVTLPLSVSERTRGHTVLEFAFSGGRCCCQVPVGFLLKLRLDLISVLPLCFTQAPRYSEGHFGVFVRKSFLLCLLSSPVGLLCVCEGLLSCVRPSRGFPPVCVCPGAENDPDVSVQLKRTNIKLVDHHDLHTHTHTYRNLLRVHPALTVAAQPQSLLTFSLKQIFLASLLQPYCNVTSP